MMYNSKRFSHWLTDRILRGVIASAMALPYERRVPMMGKIVARFISPIAGYRRRAEEQFELIYPELDAGQRRDFGRDVCDNFGRTVIENYSWKDLSKRLKNTQLKGEGLEALKQAKQDNRPVLFVTGHYGNHEVPRHILTHMGHKIGGLYRPASNPYFNEHYEKTMTSWGGPVFAQGRRGTAGFARHLRAGGMATLLFDVADHSGIPIPFLDRPAMTSTSTADLALKYDALVLPYFGVRRQDGLSFDAYLEEPIPHGSPLDMMTHMTKRLEARIEADPSQWFWVHRRWK